jgi:hypothetical protein
LPAQHPAIHPRKHLFRLRASRMLHEDIHLAATYRLVKSLAIYILNAKTNIRTCYSAHDPHGDTIDGCCSTALIASFWISAGLIGKGKPKDSATSDNDYFRDMGTWRADVRLMYVCIKSRVRSKSWTLSQRHFYEGGQQYVLMY